MAPAPRQHARSEAQAHHAQPRSWESPTSNRTISAAAGTSSIRAFTGPGARIALDIGAAIARTALLGPVSAVTSAGVLPGLAIGRAVARAARVTAARRAIARAVGVGRAPAIARLGVHLDAEFGFGVVRCRRVGISRAT